MYTICCFDIVNAATNISYRPLLEELIQADIFVVLFMNEFKNFTNGVIGKLGKVIYKKKKKTVLPTF